MIWSRYKTAAIVIAPDGLLTYNRAEYGMLRATLPGMYVRARARVAAAPHSAVVSRKFLAGHEITVRGEAFAGLDLDGTRENVASKIGCVPGCVCFISAVQIVMTADSCKSGPWLRDCIAARLSTVPLSRPPTRINYPRELIQE